MTNPVVNAGLEGVVAAATRLSDIDGQAGVLTIAGFPLAELAPNASFEEVVYLMWHDELPKADALNELRQHLAKYRAVSPATLAILRESAARRLPVMDALRIGVSTLSLNLTDPEDLTESAYVVVGALPTIVAAYWRYYNGQEPIAPHPELDLAANYLYMLTGTVPSRQQVRALETYLNTVVDHGLNASTFVARAIISTRSDMVSAITGAIGSLKGPLHGGAPGPALDMVFEIGTPDRAEEVIRAMLARGERLMGFGHRVYKVRDPRADVLNAAAAEFFRDGEQAELYALVRHVEAVALRLLEEHKPDRKLQTNVEFYTALVLHGIGLPTDLFTATFAAGRVAGWTAHAFEHAKEGRLVRPTSIYTGVYDRVWVPLAER
jgi:citrate synthase